MCLSLLIPPNLCLRDLTTNLEDIKEQRCMLNDNKGCNQQNSDHKTNDLMSSVSKFQRVQKVEKGNL